MTLPKRVEHRQPRVRRDLASALRSAAAGLDVPSRKRSGGVEDPDIDPELIALREKMRNHPGHHASDRDALVRVIGKPEPLFEIAAANPFELARLAWHLGNRHADVQLVGDRLRIRRDHVLAAMLEGLGARVTAVEAPFDPESGAYERHPHEHERGA